MTRYMLLGAAAAIFAMASPVQAELITNGSFESVSGGNFNSWAANLASGTTATTSSVCNANTTNALDGATSAELIRAASSVAWLYQFASLAASDRVVTMDYACFANEDSNRTMDITVFLKSATATSAIGDPCQVIIKSGVGGQLYAYNETTSSWVTLTGLISNTSTDTNGNKAWDAGETAVKNTLTITLHLSAATPYYDVTLNGVTVANISDWWSSSGTAVPASGWVVDGVSLQSQSSTSNWLADNVSIAAVPEPSTLVLLYAGLTAFLAYAWRRRK